MVRKWNTARGADSVLCGANGESSGVDMWREFCGRIVWCVAQVVGSLVCGTMVLCGEDCRRIVVTPPPEMMQGGWVLILSSR